MTKILSHAKWIPLWSCIYRDKFGYGRVPATSASSGSDFNDLKTRLIKNEQLPMRIDDFITKHVDNLTGKLKIIDAAETRKDSNVEVTSKEPISKVNTDFQSELLEKHSIPDSAIKNMIKDEELKIISQRSACMNGDIPEGAHKYLINIFF